MQDIDNNQGSDLKKVPKSSLYYRLILVCSTIAVLSSSIVGHPLSEITILALITAILIYIFTVYFLSNNGPKAQYTLYTINGLILALAISELKYCLWSCLVLLALLYLDALSQGGIKQWLFTNIGVLVGLITGFFILEIPLINKTNHPIVNIATTIGTILCLCLYGMNHYLLLRKMREKNQLLDHQVKEQKLRAYEMSRYVPKPIRLQIEGKKKTKIERKPITIFFSDIVGFSSLSEELEAETLSEILSSYLGEMSKIVGQYTGTIDKFIGDAIMVTYGDDHLLSKGVKKDAIACVSMALAMGKRMRELQPIWAEMGIKKPLQIRIGINSGYCTVGTFGTSQHMDHTALGVHVNLASRLESAGQPGDILVSHETWNLIKDTILCKDKGKIKAKGFTHPVQVFQVINHRKELGSNQSYFSETTEGFSMHLDMQKVKNYDREKVVYSLELAAKKLKERFLGK
ncbi:hypothetical protein AB835_08355 [Candidatus Endobugula sertula]|uniref:Guanylate cyclase domain-containing protein n=1 Tax=Candidatus Endobugula sertula TaxID=62101 RepID=A0A1D2QPK7_9GAMM|nr:hypothetical protein AB835_08355 [Candidatus Endobugula sertula]